MAYYSSSYYQSDDHGQYYSTPYEPSTQNLFAYDPNPYYHAFHSTPTLPNISYYASAYSESEPLSIECDPTIYGNSYETDVTKFVLSYSVSEFNEPEFEEYDPTPYGGGFDLAQVYGKPLSPSDNTCYPRSSAPAGLNAAPTSNGVKEETGEQVPQVKPLGGVQEVQVVEEEQGKGNQIEESKKNGGGDDEYEKQGRGNQIEESGENRASYEFEKQGNLMPSGYGLEAMDICESLFGYWPCLAKDIKRGNGNGTCQEICGEGMYGNPWKGTSDYLFGSSNPYGDTRDDCSYYGGSVYPYETH